MPKEIGHQFQQETKYHRDRLSGSDLRWDSKPETYKTYPESARIKLPKPVRQGGSPVWEVILSRRSVRGFQNRPLPFENLSQLLWATQGITHESMGYELRAAPSAGALYPVETYLAVHNVEDLESGIYHFRVKSGELELLKRGDYRLETARAALDQDMAYSSNAVFIWTAIFARAVWKYRERAFRYVYLDAGHIAENLALAAVALDLGSCQIAALFDDEVNSLLGIDGKEESALYMSVVGFPL